jgi:hypothetical protein
MKYFVADQAGFEFLPCVLRFVHLIRAKEIHWS